MANYHDITIALAGTCQTACLVQEFAHKGSVDKNALAVSLKSLLVTQPENTLAVYGNELTHLKKGFETVLSQFSGGKGKLDTEMGRYWISILMLSRKLTQQPDAKIELANRLQQITRQLPLYEDDILSEQIIANIAAIYSDIISPLGSRIQVLGSPHFLNRQDIQNRVRATLLAGIRSGILWHQVGGSRWQFLFSRKKIFNTAHSFYSSL